MGWQDKFTFLTPNYIEHKIGDKEYKFYPLTVSATFKLRRFAPPVARALATLFDNKRNDIGQVLRDVETADGPAKETIVEAINPDLAQLRHDTGRRAWEELLTALGDEDNLKLIAELILNSLKADVPPSEFIKEVPVDQMWPLLEGVLKANKGVLGPLADQLTQISSQAIANVQSKVDGLIDDEESPSATSMQDG